MVRNDDIRAGIPLLKPLLQSSNELLMQINAELWSEYPRIAADIPEVIESGFRIPHRLFIAGLKISPHCAAKEINAIDGDAFVV